MQKEMAKDGLWGKMVNGLFGSTRKWENAFNRAMFQFIGGQVAQYDYKDSTYIEKGYSINPDVFSVVNQMCDKTKSVPYYIKKIKDKNQQSKLNSLRAATNGAYSLKQRVDVLLLQNKAYEDKELPFPMDKPNPGQTWADILSLYKLYLKINGNFYAFMIWPEEGVNKGVPKMLYVLPSHKIQIVLKKDADLLYDQNPIDYYMLRDGDQNLKFPVENIIHIKTPNPLFDMQGGHLYGLSPVRALLMNIESSNEALKNNVKTIKNSGSFGILHGKNEPLTSDMALQLKERLVDMDKDPGRMSKITAISGSVDFTRLSLTTDELQPFEFLKYDQKQICNVFGWSDSLLNNDDGGKYDKQKEERKRVITDNIHPDLILFQEKMTELFIRRFKGYEDAVWEFDITELPEMQEDYKAMVEWMDKAPLTPNEKRSALKYETLKDDGMDVVWINGSLKRIDEVGITASDLEKSFKFLDKDII